VPGSVLDDADNDREEIPMTWLLMNIPLMVVFFALWTAVPLWLVLKRRGGTVPEPARAEIRYLAQRSRVRGEAGYRDVA
jgi:hypothetical protein